MAQLFFLGLLLVAFAVTIVIEDYFEKRSKK